MNYLCVVWGGAANYGLHMKHILISAAIIGLAACSPASTAETQETEASMVMPKVGNWTLVPSESHIKFTATQTSDEFTGEFKDFDVTINFEFGKIDEAFVTAIIDMSSFEAGDSERNGALPTKDWFYVKQFPEAVFTSDAFSEIGEGNYEADGILTIRGVSKPLTLPFFLNIKEGDAVMTGSASLNRGDYKIGQGAWATDEWVSLDVKVDVKVTATR